ncbi:hypothetical protein LCGC14_1819340 [marine sediment metagenome]|uniref:Uncharacterized protein n=1 Tax=marine sediment metagenome TaxID=412755 RepID=A0A0F9GJF7_9ZZZZ
MSIEHCLVDRVRKEVHQLGKSSSWSIIPKEAWATEWSLVLALVRFADSLYDYIFKVLDIRYFGGVNSGLDARISDVQPDSEPPDLDRMSMRPTMSADGPPCGSCGNITRRNGACYLCESCGQTTGCS